MRLRRSYDLAVLGGGTAGLVAAIGAARIGARTILFERERTGGDCLWTGCVPSKSLLAAAAAAQDARTADRVGLEPSEPRIDFARVMAHVHGARATIEPHDSPERLRREGVEVVAEDAHFLEPGWLEAGGRRVRYVSALIATGSRPQLPPVEGLDAGRALTNETVWDLTELPRRLAILGGGPIGCELGQAFARLGSEVTIVEQQPALLASEEPEAGRLLGEPLAAEGVGVLTGRRVERVAFEGEGGRLELDGRGEDEDGGGPVAFDRLLVATGRAPDTAGLGLEAVEVKTTDAGAVRVDERLRTTGKRIFAAGDVTGGPQFTHLAAHQAGMVVSNALFRTRRSAPAATSVPWVIFTDPEIARVGLTEAQAREREGEAAGAQRFDHDGLDRAVAAGAPHGFAKLVTGPRGRLLGATLAGPASGESIAGLAAVVARGGRVRDVFATIHPYPTFSEAASRAAGEYLGERYVTTRNRRLARSVLAPLRALGRLG
jgi:pyruvate/2-oxoglutarate dehydrogenase complex dihydrolipoamide dehydrogenase (E3) component